MEKNIHFVVLGDSCPDWAQANMNRFAVLNPGWTVMVHRGLFDMPAEYRHALEIVQTVGGQSDVLRMAALDVWGGWYFDWDVYAVRPIEETATHAMLGERLLTWQYPSQPGTGTSICAAAKDSTAWPHIRQFMQEVGDIWRPIFYGLEYPLCLHMRKRHGETITTGDPAEFTVRNNLRMDRDVYRDIMAGTYSGDLGRCAFLHGWSARCKGPSIEIGA